MSWSAERYVRFEAERTRPDRDLIAAVPLASVTSAVDLGCGPGNSTAVLRDRFPDASIIAIDSSPDMIATARRRLPGLTFREADLGTWRSAEPVDLIVANAALQWVPDHERLLPRLLDQLAPGGRLAFQIPDNWDEPSHRLMRELAADPRWASRLAGAERTHAHRHPAAWYHDLLRPLASDVEVWRTTYYHELADAAAIVEWFRGSALRPLIDRLDADDATAFLAAYTAAIDAAYPRGGSGTVLLPFPRLFVVARR